ncbi:hypothetical protein D3C87_2143680 [compost metagenome]
MNGDMGLTPNYGPGFLTLNAILSQVMEMRGGGRCIHALPGRDAGWIDRPI